MHLNSTSVWCLNSKMSSLSGNPVSHQRSLSDSGPRRPRKRTHKVVPIALAFRAKPQACLQALLKPLCTPTPSAPPFPLPSQSPAPTLMMSRSLKFRCANQACVTALSCCFRWPKKTVGESATTTTAFCTVLLVTSAGRSISCRESSCRVQAMPKSVVLWWRSVKYEKSSSALCAPSASARKGSSGHSDMSSSFSTPIHCSTSGPLSGRQRVEALRIRGQRAVRG